MRFFCCLLLVAMSFSANAAQDLISELRKAEARFGLPDMSLVALSKTESSLNWYALNFDDVASFYPTTKRHALNIIRNISGRPYSIKVEKPSGNTEVYFFPSQQAAQSAISKVKRTPGYAVVEHYDGTRIKKLDLLNTGLCAMQLNFRWQGHKQGRTAEDLLDRSFCIEHAAKFLARLVREHGFKKGVGCYYTCGSSERARKDRADYFARYERHLKRLEKSSALAQR